MRRKYPLLIKFKKPDENYKNLYLRMITYIAKLQEEFGIPYIHLPDLDPMRFYNKFKYSKLERVLSYAASNAAKVGNVKLVNELIDRGANNLGLILVGAAEGGNIDLVKNLILSGLRVN